MTPKRDILSGAAFCLIPSSVLGNGADWSHLPLRTVVVGIVGFALRPTRHETFRPAAKSLWNE